MLKYRVGIPVGLFLLLLVVGVRFDTAFFIGVMSGCMAMMFMMIGRGSGPADGDNGTDDRRKRRQLSRSDERGEER